jgi:hypothetical protein
MAEITCTLGSWIHDILEYNPRTGEFFWRISIATVHAGDRAGSIYANGYRYIQMEGVDYRAARVAWFMMTGEDPVVFVDHLNRIRDDDRFDNLRLATNSQNQANAWWSTNTSGFKGVTWQKSRGQWAASITIDNKQKFLGRFNTRVEAAKAYRNAAVDAWGEFAECMTDEEIEALDKALQ